MKYMAFSREIIKKVLQYVQFRVPATEEKDSYYTQIGDTLVRLSNHCTRLYVWDDILEKNPKWKGLPIVSIVFEDTEVTFNEVECLTLKRFRKKPIKVNEYVYNLQGNPQFLTPQYEKLIIQSIKDINEGQYKDTTNKCSPPQVRISRNPINENKEYKTKKDMKKQVIRITESDLHQIIKESVNKILKEGKHYSYPCLPNLNTKVVEYVKTKHPNEVLPYDRDDDDRYYVEALLNLGFKRDGYDRDGSEVFSNGKLRVTLSIDSINNVLIVSPANGYASTLGL